MPNYNEPVTIQEARDFLRIDSDDEQDDILCLLITAAREEMEKRLCLSLIQRSGVVEHFRKPCCGGIIGSKGLKYGPVVGDVLIKDIQGNVVELENCGTDEFPKYNFTYSVDVTYTAGYTPSTIPAALKRSLLMIVGTGYKDRENTTELSSNMVKENAYKIAQPFSRNVF
jgi:hypothetical protein